MTFWKERQVPIGAKIFGIAASMLGLLLVVVGVSSNRLRQVSREIEALAEYIIPITDAVAKMGIHALEQEVLLERILKHYEIEPIDYSRIAEETIEFDQRNRQVDAELSQIEALAEEATALIAIDKDQEMLMWLVSRLTSVEQQHQEFYDRGVEILALLEAGKFSQARELERELAIEEEEFDRSIEEILIELEAFTVEAAQTGQSHQQIVQQLSVVTALLATGGGSFVAWIVAFGLVRPVRHLAQKMEAVQQGDLSVQATVSSRDEISTLATAFNQMVTELKSKAQLEETFGKYVDPRVVQQLLTDSAETKTAGDRQVMTVLFSDVEGFDAMTEALSPDELVSVTNQYFTVMAQPVSDQSGVIDKFINTTVMGFWGPPFSNAQDHAALACTAALEHQKQLVQIAHMLQFSPSSTVDNPALSLRVGIATGPLVVGNMGSNAAKSYTVMGDTVNIASRLKGVSKQYGVAIAITQETQAMLGDRYETRELDLIRVLGKEEPVRVYELLGHQGRLDDATQLRRDQFAKGLEAYRRQWWDAATVHFSACSTSECPDPPALLYLNRINMLRHQPPPDTWDGVWHMTKK
ncbi:MAG: adenylate/guanylate cyclase domain-containing protein [Cyanobacteria bacterium P01_E01_bin.6]